MSTRRELEGCSSTRRSTSLFYCCSSRDLSLFDCSTSRARLPAHAPASFMKAKPLRVGGCLRATQSGRLGAARLGEESMVAARSRRFWVRAGALVTCARGAVGELSACKVRVLVADLASVSVHTRRARGSDSRGSVRGTPYGCMRACAVTTRSRRFWVRAGALVRSTTRHTQNTGFALGVPPHQESAAKLSWS